MFVRNWSCGPRTLAARVLAVLSVVVVLLASASAAVAEPITLNNPSFESPVVPFAEPFAMPVVDGWQKAPAPGWWLYSGYTENQWSQTVGTFLNVPFAPIDNVDGSQAAFFFATPDVELYQDTATAFEAGKAYRLSMLVEGGGSAYSLMKAGVPIEIRLFFRDRGGNRITVGSAGTVNTNVSGWIGHLNDLVLDLPAVKATDAWAGKNIGVQIVSTVGYDDAGGYWDIDNVRLNSATVGDANFDGLVNDNDLGALLSAWGTGNTWGQGDFNADGAVDDNDLGTLLSAWTGSAAAAPEPLTIGMLMIGGALALRRRN